MIKSDIKNKLTVPEKKFHIDFAKKKEVTVGTNFFPNKDRVHCNKE